MKSENDISKKNPNKTTVKGYTRGSNRTSVRGYVRDKPKGARKNAVKTDPLDAEIRERLTTPDENELHTLTGNVAEIRPVQDEDGEDAAPQIVCAYLLPGEETDDNEANTVYLAFDSEIFPNKEDYAEGQTYFAVISEMQGQLLELMNPARAEEDEFKSSDWEKALFGPNRKPWTKSVFDCRLLNYDTETGLYEIECAREEEGGQKRFSKKRYAKKILEEIVPHELGALLILQIYERPGARLHFLKDGQGEIDPETFNFENEWAEIERLYDYSLRFSTYFSFLLKTHVL